MLYLSFYRIWEYPSSVVPYKHVYIKRDRDKIIDNAARNTSAILDILKEQDREGKFAESLSRSKRNIRDLVLCNQFEYFCTFTFDEQKIDRYNYNECQKKLRKFFNNFKNRYSPNFQYLIIPEFHKDGAVHFHGLCSGFSDGELIRPEKVLKRVNGQLTMVPNTRGYLDWTRYHKAFGIFNCSKVRNYDACAFYITKYITKDLADMEKGQRVYMCSSGLNRPKMVFDADDVPLIFEPEFENEHCMVAYERAEATEPFIDDTGWMYGEVVPWDYDNESDCDLVVFNEIEGEQLNLYGL